jgi:Pyridoxamine 5'-phosphate oxidase
MTTWSDLERAAPVVAAAGRELIYRNGDGEALLVTVRVHPVNVGIVDGHLYTFVQAASAKRRDLDEDGRYAIHTHVDPTSPSEFMVRGHVRLVSDEAIRSVVARDWFFAVADSYPLYELLVEHALLGVRGTADDWPPLYTSWRELGPTGAERAESAGKSVD